MNCPYPKSNRIAISLGQETKITTETRFLNAITREQKPGFSSHLRWGIKGNVIGQIYLLYDYTIRSKNNAIIVKNY